MLTHMPNLCTVNALQSPSTHYTNLHSHQVSPRSIRNKRHLTKYGVERYLDETMTMLKKFNLANNAPILFLSFETGKREFLSS